MYLDKYITLSFLVDKTKIHADWLQFNTACKIYNRTYNPIPAKKPKSTASATIDNSDHNNSATSEGLYIEYLIQYPHVDTFNTVQCFFQLFDSDFIL